MSELNYGYHAYPVQERCDSPRCAMSTAPTSSSRLITGFTTSRSPHPTQPGLTHLPLEDFALGVHKVSKGTSHKLVAAHATGSEQREEGESSVWEAFFPEGSVNPGNKHAPLGGFGFYLSGGEGFAKALKESVGRAGGEVVDVVMGYEVFFQEGWEWGKGGKLPGICTSPLEFRALVQCPIF